MKQRQTTKEKKAVEQRYSNVFLVVWTLIAVGVVASGYKYYYDHPEKWRSFEKPVDPAVLEAELAAQAENAVQSKRQAKIKAREDKRANAGKNARR